jgi:hypothetical protein
MWPFSNRGTRLDVEEALLKHKPDFDFTPFKYNDASIKLWMPEKIITSIDVLSIKHKVSRPDTLRWVFFEHAYGRELFAGLCVYSESLKVVKTGRRTEESLKSNQYDGMPLFCLKDSEETPRSVNQRFLGKATEDVKLWIPGPLKGSLQKLADHKNDALSDYLRAVLVRHLFGEQFYAEWQQALADINIQAIQHENPIYVKGEQENLIQPPMWS